MPPKPKPTHLPANSADHKSAAVFVPIDKLVPWTKNPRKNDASVKAVADSIKRFGFGAPVLARLATGEIIAGHTRVKAARSLGLVEVPVRYLDLSESEAHALALADNKLGELAAWDDEALADILRDMTEAGDNIEGLGWGSAEIEALMEWEIAAPKPSPDQTQDLIHGFQIVVQCESEEQQVTLIDRFLMEGLKCRALVL